MKNFFIALTFAVTIIFANTCAAQDVWIAHRSDGIDIYAMDDTIRNTSSGSRKSFSVSTKFVRNGQLQEVVNWSYGNSYGMWRYETSTMDGSHDTAVIPRDALFEFCMNRLGWSYRIFDTRYD